MHIIFDGMGWALYSWSMVIKCCSINIITLLLLVSSARRLLILVVLMVILIQTIMDLLSVLVAIAPM